MLVSTLDRQINEISLPIALDRHPQELAALEHLDACPATRGNRRRPDCRQIVVPQDFGALARNDFSACGLPADEFFADAFTFST